MRVGIVGVGAWGQKLAGAFKHAGNEIVAHARSRDSAEAAPGFGQLMPRQALIASVDAVACAAPPDVSWSVAVACANQGVPVFATKPLMLETPLKLSAPFFVDYVRLWSPQWQRFKKALVKRRVREMVVYMYGDGPVREFSSLLDYGPHAFAFLHDALGAAPASDVRPHVVRDGQRERIQVTGTINGVRFTVITGNGWDRRMCRVSAYLEPAADSRNDVDSVTFEELRDDADSSKRSARFEDAKGVADVIDHDPLADEIADFCAAVVDRRVDPRLMLLTCAIAESLRSAQRAGAEGP